ncbi:4-hydroxythreonine-4-phosphate dehydrogenase PdxA [Paludibacter sp. 221]|uniref:4-hydroxythreonine-4-phosphate dehydrogenase PdxA n=1 Tax=Paludibacter sp. 221 TaxID=2302939 RepID=UPI0013D04B2C|nr:4-hydroxythreonine-4-phosphate dehydrogenase PdxA [Paludibacter sp. 221]NDV45760.1 4-hydroxythreonine-4-phosphate dehydrogenase PdxA [Paludibacter sp. 221]
MEERIVIGITHGDINGIGYEVILKALSDNHVYEYFIPVIYGSSKIAAYYRKHLDLVNLNLNMINSVSEAAPKRINIVNCVDEDIKVEFGRSTKEAGKAAFVALERASEDLKNGDLQALVTAPINKENIQSDDFSFPGHTEYLQEKFADGNSAVMLLASDITRVAVATGHIPVKSVAKTLSEELIVGKLRVLNNALKQDFGIIRPRIAVLGLNPHAGDNGVIGDEEEKIIVPAMKKAEEEGIVCVGPYAADGFFGSDKFGMFDAILAMYHDQGLIPFKALSMDEGVNVTLGLSVVRTSPAHGTAYDLAGKNEASENSFRQALYMAYDIYRKRTWEKEISANPLKPTGLAGNGPDE